MDNKELVKQWARDDYNVGLTLGESDYIAFCDYCADKGIECSWELFNEYLDEVERCINEEPLPYEVDPNDFIEEDIEVKVEADEPEELASFAKCVLGSNCEFFDQDFDQPVVDVEMPKAKFDVEPMKYEDEDETSEISDKEDEDELEEAQCKYYKSITHPDDDMKQLKEEDEEDDIDPKEEFGNKIQELLEDNDFMEFGDPFLNVENGREVVEFEISNAGWKGDHRDAWFAEDQIDKAYDFLKKNGYDAYLNDGVVGVYLPKELTEDVQVGLDDFLIQDQADEKVPADWEDWTDEEFVEEFGKAIAAKRLKESKLNEAGLANIFNKDAKKFAGSVLGHGDMNDFYKFKVYKFDKDNKQVANQEVKNYKDAAVIAQSWSKNPTNGKAVIAAVEAKKANLKQQIDKSASDFKNQLAKGYAVSAYVSGKETANKISDLQKITDSIQKEVGKVKSETNNGQGETNNGGGQPSGDQTGGSSGGDQVGQTGGGTTGTDGTTGGEGGPVKPEAPNPRKPQQTYTVTNGQNQPVVKVKSLKAAQNAVVQANADNKAVATIKDEEGKDKVVVNAKGQKVESLKMSRLRALKEGVNSEDAWQILDDNGYGLNYDYDLLYPIADFDDAEVRDYIYDNKNIKGEGPLEYHYYYNPTKQEFLDFLGEDELTVDAAKQWNKETDEDFADYLANLRYREIERDIWKTYKDGTIMNHVW